MSQFVEDNLDFFLGIIRKYMQVRGGLSQKELAEATGVGVSTMSRFLNQKTSELNPQLIAKIVAELNVPLHEMIDFVDESFADHFIKLVKLYKGEERSGEEVHAPVNDSQSQGEAENELIDALSSGGGGTAQKTASADISIGAKKSRLTFQPDLTAKNSQKSIKEKMSALTSRQKGFLTEFLNLDMDGRDLVVDIGKNIITYLRQKGMDF